MIRNALLIIINDRSFELSVNNVYVRVCVYCTLDIFPCTTLRLTIDFDWHQNKNECNIVLKILLIFEIFNLALLILQAIIANEILSDFKS